LRKSRTTTAVMNAMAVETIQQARTIRGYPK